ncbi:class I SAM-dependent methyltransferase [Methylocella sp. CPCC 101449]|uniref:class I SAM-dependent methyltransferase n=1 Tax=Methylocella sp. CPCC 101449 TaxID=2987531 RepID=UPI00288E4E65|nr:class I SAM-dependent methyltransferase [Methylocella sp. CPCC 101449]MDT2022807.1 class I SAM-dependent methyltransferase [Methylocella sp. CPCC 101449]
MSFDTYMGRIEQVEGWLVNSTATYSHSLMKFQTQQGISGNACEVGIHHGRYFLALALALAGNEQGVAIDLFGHQDQNIDNSGQGDKEKFLQNVDSFWGRDHLTVIEGNSLQMTSETIANHGLVRFFSIDGGHDERTTVHDLKLAEQSICKQGIVALDDIFNPHWSGVISGLVRYLAEGGRLRPMLLIPNKLLLAFPESAAMYRAYMRQEFAGTFAFADREFFGSCIDVYNDQNPPPAIIEMDFMRAQVKELEARADELVRETIQFKELVSALEAQKAGLEMDCSNFRSQIAELKSSRAYRIGTSLTGAFGTIGLRR